MKIVRNLGTFPGGGSIKIPREIASQEISQDREVAPCEQSNYHTL